MIIKDLLSIYAEKARTRKALRLLNKQEWSVEFLTSLLANAAKKYGKGLEMTIMSPNGAKIVVRPVDYVNNATFDENNIFNNLDNDLKINEFIKEMQK